MRRIFWGTCLAATIMILGGYGSARADRDAGITKKADAVARQRAEVARLEAELRSERTEAERAERALLASVRQRELQLEQARARLGSVKKLVAERKERVEAQAANQRAGSPEVIAQIDALRDVIAAQVPFRREERIAQLDQISREVKLSRSSPQTAREQLWRWVESELELARSASLHRQVLTIGGSEQLVDVARLGTAALYWRSESAVGIVRLLDDNTWRAEAVEGEDAEAITSLIEAMRTRQEGQIFDLPLPVEGAKR